MTWYRLLTCLIVIGAAGCGGGGGGDDASDPLPRVRYTLSGSFLAEAGNRVDSDVNDTLGAEPQPNDTFVTAQSLGRLPVSVGGYLNLANQGPAGRSFEKGDPTDIFLAANMRREQVVRLALPDDADAAIDLELFARSDTAAPVAVQTGITRNGALLTPANGTYFIKLTLARGATSYHLNVGEAGALSAAGESGRSARWVPGDVLVKLHDRAAESAAVFALADTTGMHLAEGRHGGWLRFRTTDFEATFRRLNLSARSRGSESAVQRDLQDQRLLDTLLLVRALAQDPRVAYAEPNYIRRPLLIPDDPLYSFQWNLDMINLPAAWDISLGREDVIVAVVDTGVVLDHPDLQAKLVPGYDFVSDPDTSGDGDGVDENPDDPGDGVGGGSSFHGTHVAGIVAAQFDNGIGVAGAGRATRVMPVRVLGRDGGSDTDIANGILWAAGIDVTVQDQVIPGASPPADIINLSLGGDAPSMTLCDAISQARAAGAIVIAAAGNSASPTPIFPAGCNGVVSVSAVAADANPAPYTNFGTTIDLSAPGGNLDTDHQPDGYVDGVLSTLGNDAGGTISTTYGYFQGTSMAAPHVAGVAALMKAERAQLTPDEFQAWIETGSLTGSAPFEHDQYYGYGLIDAFAAVRAVQDAVPTVLSISPQSLDFGADITTAALFARKTGDGELTVSAAGTFVAPDWVNVTYADNQTDRLGRYLVAVDRGALAGGIHTGVLRIPSSINAVTIPVRAAVLPDPSADAGTQYLLLIDVASGQTVAQVILTAEQGRYDFSFSDVAPGNYYLVSGSDLDNDTQITDQAEAVGGYPSLAGFAPLGIQADRDGVQFITGFSQRPFLHPVQANRVESDGQ